jgi:PAS domain S-box-containing protein
MRNKTNGGTTVASLKKRVAALETELATANERINRFWKTSRDSLVLVDKNGVIKRVSDSLMKMGPIKNDEIIGKNIFDITKNYLSIPESRKIHRFILHDSVGEDKGAFKFIANGRCLELRTSLKSPGEIDRLVYLRDITRREKTLQALSNTHKALVKKTGELNQKNIALREVLSNIQNEKNAVKIQIAENIEKRILPLFAKVKEHVPKADRDYIVWAENALNEITQLYTGAPSSRFSTLTPRQIELCMLIRNRRSSKEIARLMSISVLTVNRHREAIRKKIGIANKNVNLTTYLCSMHNAYSE